MNDISIESSKNMLLKVCQDIIDSKPLLTEIDSKIGDGDHGIGMAGGCEKAIDALRQQENHPDLRSVFNTVGMAMMNSMGGASGVIFGSVFMGGSQALSNQESLNVSLLTRLFRAGLDLVKQTGKAQPGDKTMVDALEPAVLVLESYQGDDLVDALAQAKAAAADGVEKTKNYVARFGRAKSLGERAIGYQDAGATSVMIIFTSMHEFLSH